jgi:hypothetical protein
LPHPDADAGTAPAELDDHSQLAEKHTAQVCTMKRRTCKKCRGAELDDEIEALERLMLELDAAGEFYGDENIEYLRLLEERRRTRLE